MKRRRSILLALAEFHERQLKAAPGGREFGAPMLSAQADTSPSFASTAANDLVRDEDAAADAEYRRSAAIALSRAAPRP